MSATDNGTTYRAIIEAVNRGDLDAFAELIAPDLVDHNPVPGQPAGLEGIQYWTSSVRTTFPDLTGSVEDLLVDGDRVAARVTWRGTHAGAFLGVPATGRRLEFSAFHILRFAFGRAVDWWGTADLLGALLQAGATIRPPAP